MVQLDEVAEINPRRPADLNRSKDASTTFVPMAAVDAVRGIITDPETKPFAQLSTGYTFFAQGDVLFAKITPCMQNGKHAVVRDCIHGIGFASTEFHVIRAGDSILPDWIHAFVRRPEILLNAVNHFTGAVGQQRLPPDYLRHLRIPLPLLSEQTRPPC